MAKKTVKGDKLENIRHSLAHLLAAAVLGKYPEAKLGMGPVVENGFYYDFKFPEPASESILSDLEKEMSRLIAKKIKFEKKKIIIGEAKKLFKNQPFKLELAEEYHKEGKQLTIYKSGDFIDLCEGGHVKDTSEINIGGFKITKIAGAYWRGSEKNPMLTRIYGVAFATKKDLDEYLEMLKEAEKRDHRKLGQQLGLFIFDETSPGMPYWLPRGLVVFNKLLEFWRKDHAKRGYQEIRTPLLNKKELYLTSGHWDHYRENMFISETAEGEVYCLKPMNCPNAMVVFASQKRSYRELPLRFSDTAILHRFELSGTLNGLLRVREFSQDDAHIFITEDQIQDEYQNILDITEKFYSLFSIEYSFRLGTRPKKFMGDSNVWDKAEKELKNILKKSGKDYTILEGDGAFYGPKIDILMKDALGRDWQTGTVQLDFQIPQRFQLTYTAADGKQKTPVVVHRVIYGSLERFMGILIEHCAGAFPFWLAPVQIKVLPISEEVKKYSEEIFNKLQEMGFRAEIDERNETIGKKIREAELQKIPYLLVIGKREAEAKTVAIRKRGKGDVGTMDFIKFLKQMEGEQDKYA